MLVEAFLVVLSFFNVVAKWHESEFDLKIAYAQKNASVESL